MITCNNVNVINHISERRKKILSKATSGLEIDRVAFVHQVACMQQGFYIASFKLWDQDCTKKEPEMIVESLTIKTGSPVSVSD